MNTIKTLFIAAVLLLAVCIPWADAQQPSPGVTLQAVTGTAPNLISSVAGAQGTTTAYYVLMANFTGGSIPSNIVTVTNTPNTLSSTNYVSFIWQPVAGVTTYDLLKLTSAALPTGSNSVLLHGTLASTVTSSTDQGTSLTSYTIAATPSTGSANIILNSRDYTTPQVEISGNGITPGIGLNSKPLTNNMVATVTTDATATGVTLAAAKMVNGVYAHAIGGDVNDTTATAAQLVAALPACYVNGAQGTSFNFSLKNTAAGANTITVVGGTGVTVSGTATVAQNEVRNFIGVVTACTGTPTVTLFSLGGGAF